MKTFSNLLGKITPKKKRGMKNAELLDSFNPVTNEDIEQIKADAMDKIAELMEFEPGALENALRSVGGQFSNASNKLEAAYNSKIKQLDRAYNSQIAGLRSAFMEYKLQVADHGITFKHYSDASEVINGEPLPTNLIIDDTELQKIDTAIDKLERKNYYEQENTL